MTKEQLLDELKSLLVKSTKHYELPEAIQKGDTEQKFRAPEIYKMRLPDSNDAKKKAPYIIAQYVTGKESIFPLFKLTYAKLLMDGFNIIVLIKRTVMKFKYSIFCVF